MFRGYSCCSDSEFREILISHLASCLSLLDASSNFTWPLHVSNINLEHANSFGVIHHPGSRHFKPNPAVL